MSRALLLAVAAAFAVNSPRSQGLFAEHQKQHIPTQSSTGAAIAAGDVDGDGDVDLVAGQWLRPMLLYLNDGSGAFSRAPSNRMPATAHAPTAVVLVDVDGDLDLDVVIGNQSLTDALLLNDGAGRFVAAAFPTDQDATTAVTPFDADGDGDLDLAFAVSSGTVGTGAPNRLYLNDGTGGFAPAAAGQLPAASEPTMRVLAGDVDGDGDQDLLNLNWPFPVSGLIQPSTLLINDGAATFTDQSNTMLPDLGIFGSDAAFVDLDGDTDLDLVVAGDGGLGGADAVLTNDGSGRFTRVPQRPALGAPRGFSRLAVGDVDFDGDPDVYAGDEFGDRLLINLGGPLLAPVPDSRTPGRQEFRRDLTFVDVDGDVDLDIVFGTPRGIGLHLNDGLGSFIAASLPPFPYDNDRSGDIAASDLDGDGDLDLVIGTTVGTKVLWQEAPGAFREATPFARPSFAGDLVAVADLDRDGDDDVLRAKLVGPLEVWDNDGRGGFVDVTAVALPFISSAVHDIAVGDVDRDGDLDIVLAQTGRPNTLLLNRGNGTFVDMTASAMPANAAATTSVAMGDVDGDGDLDLAFGNGFGRAVQNTIYLNSGAAFVDATSTWLPSVLDPTTEVILEDVTGDGRVDLVVANYLKQNRLYVNAGGRFTDATAARMPLDVDASFGVDAGDVDGDGAMDLAFANDNPASTATIYTQVGGLFGPSAAAPTDGFSRAVLLVDLDGDLDLDLVEARERVDDRILWNRSQHLDAPDVALIGRTYRLQFAAIAGPAAAVPVVGLAPAARPLTVPPFGTVFVDLTQAITLAPVIVPPGGATVPLTLPALSELFGQTLRSQALILRQAALRSRMTNQIADRVSR